MKRSASSVFPNQYHYNIYNHHHTNFKDHKRIPANSSNPIVANNNFNNDNTRFTYENNGLNHHEHTDNETIGQHGFISNHHHHYGPILKRPFLSNHNPTIVNSNNPYSNANNNNNNKIINPQNDISNPSSQQAYNHNEHQHQKGNNITSPQKNYNNQTNSPEIYDDALLMALDEEFDDAIMTQLIDLEKMYMTQQQQQQSNSSKPSTTGTTGNNGFTGSGEILDISKVTAMINNKQDHGGYGGMVGYPPYSAKKDSSLTDGDQQSLLLFPPLPNSTFGQNSIHQGNNSTIIHSDIDQLKERIRQLEEMQLSYIQENQSLKQDLYSKDGEITIVRQIVKKLEQEKASLLGNLVEKHTETQNMRQETAKKYNKDIEKLQTELLFQTQEIKKMKSTKPSSMKKNVSSLPAVVSTADQDVSIQSVQKKDLAMMTDSINNSIHPLHSSLLQNHVHHQEGHFNKEYVYLELERIHFLLSTSLNPYTIENPSIAKSILNLIPVLKSNFHSPHSNEELKNQVFDLTIKCVHEFSFKLVEIMSFILIAFIVSSPIDLFQASDTHSSSLTSVIIEKSTNVSAMDVDSNMKEEQTYQLNLETILHHLSQIIIQRIRSEHDPRLDSSNTEYIARHVCMIIDHFKENNERLAFRCLEAIFAEKGCTYLLDNRQPHLVLYSFLEQLQYWIEHTNKPETILLVMDQAGRSLIYLVLETLLGIYAQNEYKSLQILQLIMFLAVQHPLILRTMLTKKSLTETFIRCIYEIFERDIFPQDRLAMTALKLLHHITIHCPDFLQTLLRPPHSNQHDHADYVMPGISISMQCLSTVLLKFSYSTEVNQEMIGMSQDILKIICPNEKENLNDLWRKMNPT